MAIVPDVAALDARNRLLKHGAGAALKIDPEAQALALRLLPGFQEGLLSGTSTATGLAQ